MAEGKWTDIRTERECKACGEGFMPPRRASLTCSETCRVAHREAKAEASRLDYKARTCKECKGTFKPKRVDQVFCSKECRFEEHNRELSRAKLLYRELYHWRLKSGRHGTGTFLTQVSQAVRRWIDEDKRAGREPPPMPRVEAMDRMVKDRGARMVERDRMLAATSTTTGVTP